VVALNRAVAVAELRGPAAVSPRSRRSRRTNGSPSTSLWAARADLLARAGDHPAADAAYQRAIGLASDAAVRRFLEASPGRSARDLARRVT
jgi:RNA polymerase sigma-70 factor (ECF subfamily)